MKMELNQNYGVWAFEGTEEELKVMYSYIHAATAEVVMDKIPLKGDQKPVKYDITTDQYDAVVAKYNTEGWISAMIYLVKYVGFPFDKADSYGKEFLEGPSRGSTDYDDAYVEDNINCPGLLIAAVKHYRSLDEDSTDFSFCAKVDTIRWVKSRIDGLTEKDAKQYVVQKVMPLVLSQQQENN